MAKHILHVYGTLRPGKSEKVVVPGVLYDLGWFPGIKLGETPQTVEGPHVVCERIEVDDAELQRLDQYEGYSEDDPQGSLYIRERYNDGWIYVYNKPVVDRPIVESGDWLSYVGMSKGRAA